MSLSLIFPIQQGPNGFTSFSDHETKEAIKQNLKMLLLTNPGEYVMDPDFGVGMMQYLFDLHTQPRVDRIKPSIYRQVAKYMPYIAIGEINVDFQDIDNNAMVLRIRYRVSESVTDEYFTLTISI